MFNNKVDCYAPNESDMIKDFEIMVLNAEKKLPSVRGKMYTQIFKKEGINQVCYSENNEICSFILN